MRVPFNYQGVTYNDCTASNWDRLWCSMDAEYGGAWGHCVDCEDQGTEDATVQTSLAVQTTALNGLIFHGIHITTNPRCGNCMPGDNRMSVEIVNEHGQAARLHRPLLHDRRQRRDRRLRGARHPPDHRQRRVPALLHLREGLPGTNLAPGCVSVNVDSGTAEEACNSECSWAESDTLYFGGVPDGFNRYHQGADQSIALFEGGGGTFEAGDQRYV